MTNCNTSKTSLEGVKVIELSRLIAGPYCGQALTDKGL